MTNGRSAFPKYIDVTLPLQSGMRGVNFEPAKRLEEDGWNAQRLEIYSHAGTHMDAPLHFGVTSKTIDRYPPDRFFVDCHVIDLAGIMPGTEINTDQVSGLTKDLKRGDGLLFRTGWCRFVHEPQYRDRIPGLSKGLALWCVQRGVSLVGVEPPSVADVNNLHQLAEIHRILMEGDILIVEGLANLDQITRPKVKLVVLPLKISQGDGAPCRAVVIEA